MWAYQEDLLPSKAMKGNHYGVLFPLYSNEGASGVLADQERPAQAL